MAECQGERSSVLTRAFEASGACGTVARRNANECFTCLCSLECQKLGDDYHGYLASRPPSYSTAIPPNRRDKRQKLIAQSSNRVGVCSCVRRPLAVFSAVPREEGSYLISWHKFSQFSCRPTRKEHRCAPRALRGQENVFLRFFSVPHSHDFAATLKHKWRTSSLPTERG